jgi:hypothetical protein
MDGAHDGTKPTLQPPNDLFDSRLHSPPLITALEFPLHF